MSKNNGLEDKILDLCTLTSKDPLKFCQIIYPWGEGELHGFSGPRKWQAEMLDLIGTHLRNKETRFSPLKIAVASGHGPGKSALVSMITHWAISTCVDTKIVVTASTESQLKTKTWSEISKWFRMSANSHWWKVTATAISAMSPDHERTWRADGIPWSENSSENFAGLHNKGKRIIVIFDEASSIHDIIWDVTEGALTDSETEIIWIAFGNPTKNTGRFRECFGRNKHRWVTRQIDSRTVEGTNLEQFRQWENDYGADSDFFKVRVRGEFPSAGSLQFIGSDIVEEARKRDVDSTIYDPIILGCDIGRFGDDDTVLCIRRGRDARSEPWVILHGADLMEVASRIVDLHSKYKFDQIFVDAGGIGAGVVDRLNQLRLPVVGVQFGAGSDRSPVGSDRGVRYANKRAEMWGNMKDWLKGGAIPDTADLASELTGVEYGHKLVKGVDAIILEKKEDMKKRGIGSPDQADALALTFAHPVMPSDHTSSFETNRNGTHQSNYSPLDHAYVADLWGKK